MDAANAPPPTGDLWKRAREGDLRGAAESVRHALASAASRDAGPAFVDLHLVLAFCSLRGGDYADTTRVLDIARRAAEAVPANARLLHRIDAWCAELAYFQGRYSAARAVVDRIVDRLEELADWSYAAFAMRIRLAVLLARTDYDGIARETARALRAARASGDDYVLVQVLNVLGAAHFDCATSKLAEPHARAHLSALDPEDTLPLRSEASKALVHFEEARQVAERAGYAFAAWYVSGNIERLRILLGEAERAIPAIRRRLRVLQERGARYDEIVTRSNLAWGLRTLGLHREALHELDVALATARETGTFNVLLEFLEYDRSIVLGALGDVAGARASYKRYLRHARSVQSASTLPDVPAAAPKRPLEPHFLKRADRYILAHLERPFAIVAMATQCGVSVRTLEKGFADFRGTTAVAHVRNLRLDHARDALSNGGANVGDVAARYGFRSPTTFANEYRKRFGVAPSRTRRQRDGGP